MGAKAKASPKVAQEVNAKVKAEPGKHTSSAPIYVFPFFLLVVLPRVAFSFV